MHNYLNVISKNIIFIERITLITVIKVLSCRKKYRINKNVSIFYNDELNGLNKLFKLFLNLFFVSVQKLDFRYDDLVDERGTNIGVKIEYEDLNKVLLKIYDSDYFNFINQNLNDSAIRPYIRKRIIVDPFPRYDNKSLLQILIMFHAVSHYVKKYNPKGTPIFFLGKRPWMNVLTSYASQLGIELVPYRFSMKELKQRSMAQLRKSKYLRYLKISMEYKFSRNRDFRKIINHTNVNKRSKIIIDQVMQMYDVNTIWSSSGLLPKDVIFVSKSHNIEQNDYYDIKNAGMEFISLANSIGKGLEIPFYLPQYRKFVEKIKFIKKGNNIFENKIVDHYVEDFFSEKRYWSDMFNIVGAKIYITCHKWDYHPIAAAAAMHENGGISAFFPTSYYEFPCPDGVVYADVFFSFSPKALDIEIRHGSLIRYNVCVGNISQSRNKSFIDSASKLRKKLQNQGAVKIISFFDQRKEVQSKYTFWFEKILKEDWLGLIIKPKRPRLLRKNLGDVSILMDKAIETGRCHIFLDHESYHVKNFRNPPAEAAMASDVAIHDYLVAGTAGMEAALTGTPTLMLDTNGWNRSQIYKLGVGKVVFHDWETLWDALVEHWKRKPIPGFGDWSPILDDIDPFRDGKAAERMGTYLRWCNEGYISGLNRQAILDRANEKYGSTWGSDKITFLDQRKK